jgi:heme/copper-type cytochrome/quinol oxidase subunit 2
MSFQDQPVFFLRILYGAGLVILVVGFIGFFFFRCYQKRKNRRSSEPPAEGEQKKENPS